jgi:hypothetical protein
MALDTHAINLRGGSGYGCQGWHPGQVTRNTKKNISAGQAEWLFVLTASNRYFREDGMSFGVGDESGYIYWATCRPATPEEAAPMIAARASKLAKQQAEKELKAIWDKIFTDGERPDGHNLPEGEEIEESGHENRLYGGGKWFVLGPQYIWAVRNNGADGDYWAENNVTTGGAGAIGRRIQTTPELAAEIRRLATACGWPR